MSITTRNGMKQDGVKHIEMLRVTQITNIVGRYCSNTNGSVSGSNVSVGTTCRDFWVIDIVKIE